ncbi:hypothetical protein GTE46_004682 [Salmonella enterica subsp. enterica]|nr:hypothetical protein [Salmonella enterica subsp. enterica]EDY2803206.1 hypothetical protein [Salmonella enterica subsp. enterica]
MAANKSEEVEMKNIKQMVFYAKKSIQKLRGIIAGTIWFDNDDQDEIDALSTLAIKKAGFKRSDFFKPVRVDHLVVDDMPMEGVFDTAFCDRYKLAEDGKSWLLPASVAQPESTDSGTGENSDSISEGHTDEYTTDNTDSGDTTSATADADSAADATAAGSTDAAASTPAYEYNVNGELMADVEKEMQQPVVGMDVRHRILSQFILEDKFAHNITPEQLAEVSRLELDVSDNYIQDMLLATRNAPAIHKLNTPDLWKYTDSFKKVFVRDKRHPLSRMINFNQAYADAHPIDRGLLVKEWIKGNYVSRIEKSGTTSASAAPEPQKTSATKVNAAVTGKPATKTTYKTIDTRIGIALTKGEIAFPITAKVVEQGKAIVEADGEEFKRWSATYRVTENIQFYDEITHIAMIRQAPRDVVVGGPELRRAYVDNYLIACGTLDLEQMVFMPKRAPVEHEENLERVRKAGKNLRDMAAGRFNCNEEEAQPTGTLADEPAAAETVEPDTTKHHQDSQQVETKSSVAVTDDGDQSQREQASKQLAAERGDFVPGISDPSDPKWVHNDCSASVSASNEGEKKEVATDSAADTADYVDHQEAFSNQHEPENNHSEPSTDHNEPETPETGPKSQKPEPVTKVADGVFDASAFFADTSNQVEKTEDSPSNNDGRTTKKTEESSPDKAANESDKSDSTPEMILLLRQSNQTLQQILISQLRIEKAHRKDAAAIRGMLAMMYAAETEETEEEISHEE